MNRSTSFESARRTSRMNLGQLFETALGWAGQAMGVKFSTPIFDGASWKIAGQLTKAVCMQNPQWLHDGRPANASTRKYGRLHLHDEALPFGRRKIHARSIGPYSLSLSSPRRESAIRRPAIRGDGGLGFTGYGAATFCRKFLPSIGRRCRTSEVYERLSKETICPSRTFRNRLTC